VTNGPQKKLKTWFNVLGHIRQPHVQYMKKSSWNISRVVAHLKKDEVNDIVADISGAKPGERHHFLSAYQGGLSQVVAGLSPDERASYQILADQWNKDGLPNELRLK
jgi:hypothetical protein